MLARRTVDERALVTRPSLQAAPWHRDAACRDIPNPDIFHPAPLVGRGPPGTIGIVEPLLFCARCSIRRECLTEGLHVWAMPIDSPIGRRLGGGAEGIWGGTLETERKQALAVAEGQIHVAADLLERTFTERLTVQVAAWAKRKVRTSPRRRRVEKAVSRHKDISPAR